MKKKEKKKHLKGMGLSLASPLVVSRQKTCNKPVPMDLPTDFYRMMGQCFPWDDIVVNGVRIPVFGSRPGLQSYSPDQVMAIGVEKFHEVIGAPTKPIPMPDLGLSDEEWEEVMESLNWKKEQCK